NPEVFEAHRAGYFNRYQPKDLAEINLVEGIAQDYWRVARARHDESAIFLLCQTESGEEGSDTWLKHSMVLARLTLYIGRIERSIERNIKSLEALQTERKKIESKQLEEAKLLVQLAWRNGKEYDPARDFPPETGFEFSAADLAALVEQD